MRTNFRFSTDPPVPTCNILSVIRQNIKLTDYIQFIHSVAVAAVTFLLKICFYSLKCFSFKWHRVHGPFFVVGCHGKA